MEVDEPDREIKVVSSPEVKRAPRPKAAPIQATPIVEEDADLLPVDYDEEIAVMQAELALREACAINPPLTAEQLKGTPRTRVCIRRKPRNSFANFAILS